jgi:hypothetical protein
MALGHHRLQGKQRGAAEQQALKVVRHTALRVWIEARVASI